MHKTHFIYKIFLILYRYQLILFLVSFVSVKFIGFLLYLTTLCDFELNYVCKSNTLAGTDMNAKYALGPKVIYTAILIIDNESKSGRSQ